jgi:hypothetical protein
MLLRSSLRKLRTRFPRCLKRIKFSNTSRMNKRLTIKSRKMLRISKLNRRSTSFRIRKLFKKRLFKK